MLGRFKIWWKNSKNFGAKKGWRIKSQTLHPAACDVPWESILLSIKIEIEEETSPAMLVRNKHFAFCIYWCCTCPKLDNINLSLKSLLVCYQPSHQLPANKAGGATSAVLWWLAMILFINCNFLLLYERYYWDIYSKIWRKHSFTAWHLQVLSQHFFYLRKM